VKATNFRVSLRKRSTNFRGEVARVDIKPGFGGLNFIAAPYVPAIRAWFSPSDDWRFAGGDFTRYYKVPRKNIHTPAKRSLGVRLRCALARLFLLGSFLETLRLYEEMLMDEQKFISNIRVSTAEQRASGFGLEAQRQVCMSMSAASPAS